MDAGDQYSASSSLLKAYHEESERNEESGSHAQESDTRESQDHDSPQIFVIGDGEDLSDPGSLEANPEPENQDNDYCWTTKSWKHEDSYTLRQLHETDGSQPEQRVLARQDEAAKGFDPLQPPEQPVSGFENSIDGFSEADPEPENYDDYTCTPESWLRRNTGDLEHVYGMGHTKREKVTVDLQVLYVLHKHLRINLDLIEKYGATALCSRQQLTKTNYKALTDFDAAQSLFAQCHIGLTETLRAWEEELRPCTGVSLIALHDHFRNSRNYFAHNIGRPYPFELARFHVEALQKNYELIFEKVGKNIIVLEDHLEDESVWSKPSPFWGPRSGVPTAAESAGPGWGLESEHMETEPTAPREDVEEEGAPPGCLSGILGSCLPLKWWKGQPNHDAEGGHGKESCCVRFFAQCRRIKVVRGALDSLEIQLLNARYLHDTRPIATPSSGWDEIPPVTPHEGESFPFS